MTKAKMERVLIERIRALEDAERTCKAANESQRRSIGVLEASALERERKVIELAESVEKWHTDRDFWKKLADGHADTLGDLRAELAEQVRRTDADAERADRAEAELAEQLSRPTDPHRPAAAADPAAPTIREAWQHAKRQMNPIEREAAGPAARALAFHGCGCWRFLDENVGFQERDDVRECEG